MRDYEVMTIHRPDLAEDDVSAKIGELESHLTGQGASVDGRDLWGKRRFAYEIDHVSEGYYSVVTFQAEAAAVDSLDRMLSLADEVIRHKIVRKGGA
ncbi:MAG TPA: 30S ribosomal protein S6 [Acidimicrobiia bacterium]|jgi:small subunit ribosomal protein S6